MRLLPGIEPLRRLRWDIEIGLAVDYCLVILCSRLLPRALSTLSHGLKLPCLLMSGQFVDEGVEFAVQHVR